MVATEMKKAGTASPEPYSADPESRWFRGAQKVAGLGRSGVQVPVEVSTSLSCARSGFLEAEVGPVHSNFLTSLLCRIQTEPILGLGNMGKTQ